MAAPEKQTPPEEAAERMAEASPGLMFPRMSAIAHEHRQRKDHRRQLEHDRAVHAAALAGKAPPEWGGRGEGGEDDMGDSFSVAGDTTTTHHHNHFYPPEEGPAPPPEPPPAPEPPKPPEPPEPKSPPQDSPAGGELSGLLKTALVSAGLLGGAGVGAALPWLFGAYDRPPAANTTTTIEKSQSLGVGVEVVPGGALD